VNPSHFTITTLLSVTILLNGDIAVQAKRAAPAAVSPVIIGSVQYSAPDFPELMGFVVATNVSTGKELWRQRIYRVLTRPSLEKDVQWNFITSIIRQDSTLLITNEHEEHFTLDLNTRKVTRRH
jgi:hypothetical protein